MLVARLYQGAAAPFSPASLFAAGEQGGWYDPSDLTTVFQDTAGTTPSVVGDPVGRINDKSGRGNHLVQANSGSRPVLRQDGSGFNYLEFDGLDDCLATAAGVNFTGGGAMTVWAGLTKSSDAAGAVAVELGTTTTSFSGIAIFGPTGASGNNFLYRSRGTASSNATSAATYASPQSLVITGASDIATDYCELFINGASAASAVTDQGTGSYGTSTINWGARNAGISAPFTGRGYQLILRAASTDAGTRAKTDTYVGAKQGISI